VLSVSLRIVFNVFLLTIFTHGIPYTCGADLLVGDTQTIPYHQCRESRRQSVDFYLVSPDYISQTLVPRAGVYCSKEALTHINSWENFYILVYRGRVGVSHYNVVDVVFESTHILFSIFDRRALIFFTDESPYACGEHRLVVDRQGYPIVQVQKICDCLLFSFRGDSPDYM